MRKKSCLLTKYTVILGLISTSGAQLTEAPAWVDYNRRLRADDMANSQLLDYSYAGYHFSEKTLPNTNNWNRISVTEHGARPDDAGYDDAGIQRAIDAAAASGEPTVVFFPAGRYKVANSSTANKPIRITSSNIVLKGAGSGPGGTEIWARESGQGNETSGEWRFEFTPPSAGERDITSVTEAARRGSFRVTVADTSKLKVGQVVVLTHRAPSNIAPNFPGLSFNPNWRVPKEGMNLQESHLIERIRGNNVFFKNPIKVNYPKDPNVTKLRSTNTIQEVGMEDLLLTSGWGQNPQTFRHHENDLVDYAWNAVHMSRVHNGWIRNCQIRDWNNSLHLVRCMAVTVRNLVHAGKQGHSSSQSQSCYGILFENNIDNVDNSGRHGQSGHFHGLGVHRCSTGNVFVDCKMNPQQSIDCHSQAPYGNLFDSIQGGTFNRNGGTRHPNHGPDLTLWNFFHDSNQPKVDYLFWDTNKDRGHTFVYPKFVGFRSDEPVTLDEPFMGLNQLRGKVAYPQSLFRAQLQMRLYGHYVSASSSARRNRPEDAADNDTRTFWRAGKQGAGEWLIVDLGVDETAVGLTVDERGNHIDRYSIDYWTGSGWKGVKSGNGVGRNKTINFPPKKTRKLRFRIQSMKSGSNNRAVELTSIKANLDLDVDRFYFAGSFDRESHPSDNNRIRENSNGNVSHISNGTWIGFNEFNLGERVVRLSVNAATPKSGGTIEVRKDSPTGQILGRVDVSNTGDWGDFRTFRGNLNSSAKGMDNLFFVFRGTNGGGLFNIRSFSFTSRAIDGYTDCCAEGQTMNFSQPTDVAYGRNGRYVFKKNVTGSFRFSNSSFGSDPTPGVAKRGYHRPAQ